MRYVETALVNGGYKFDMRSYMLIARTRPLLVLYQCGRPSHCTHAPAAAPRNACMGGRRGVARLACRAPHTRRPYEERARPCADRTPPNP
eukprot:3627493-Prymnesium_polylepis.2